LSNLLICHTFWPPNNGYTTEGLFIALKSGAVTISYLFNFERGRNIHTAVQGPGNRTTRGMDVVDPFYRFPVFGSRFEMIDHMDPFDNQYVTLFLDLTFYVGDKQAFARSNFTRFQRATKGPGQSPTGGSDHIIQGGGVGLMDVGVNLIMRGNFRVDAKEGRCFFLR
jgi:hypothetical protein